MRVPQIPNSGFDGVNGGMTVYYMQDGLYNFQQTSKVQAFQPVSLSAKSLSPIGFIKVVIDTMPGLPHVHRRRKRPHQS
jgi:hypothetical protein